MRYSKSGEKCFIGLSSHFLCASVALPASSPLRTPAWVASVLRLLLLLTLPEGQLRCRVQGSGASGAARHLKVGCCRGQSQDVNFPLSLCFYLLITV